MADDSSLLNENYLHRLTARLNALDTITIWMLGELALSSPDPKHWAEAAISALRQKADPNTPVSVPSGMQRRAVQEFNSALSELMNDFEMWKVIMIDEPMAKGKPPGDLS